VLSLIAKVVVSDQCGAVIGIREFDTSDEELAEPFSWAWVQINEQYRGVPDYKLSIELTVRGSKGLEIKEGPENIEAPGDTHQGLGNRAAVWGKERAAAYGKVCAYSMEQKQITS
jgi:hypothetical protein